MIRRLVIAAILAIAIGAPIVEAFDHWDQTFQDGNDTEANAVIVALCIGVAFAIGTVMVVSRLRALASTFRAELAVSHSAQFSAPLAVPPIPTVSPPIALRI